MVDTRDCVRSRVREGHASCCLGCCISWRSFHEIHKPCHFFISVSELANSSCAATTLDEVLTHCALEVWRKLFLGVGIQANFFARTAATHKSRTKLGLVSSRPKLAQIMSKDTRSTFVALTFCETQTQLWLQHVFRYGWQTPLWMNTLVPRGTSREGIYCH